MTHQLSRPCLTDALDKMLENGAAITLHIEGGDSGPAGSSMKRCAQMVTTGVGTEEGTDQICSVFERDPRARVRAWPPSVC